MSKTLDIQEAAGQLVAALKHSPQWLAWQKATQEMEAESELQSALQQYQDLSDKWQIARNEGRQLSGGDAIKLGELQQTITGHPLYAKQEKAAADLTELIKDTNASLTKELGLDFAAIAAPQSSCCG